MFIKAEKKPLPLIIIFTTIVAMILIDVFALNFSTIFLILIGAVVGLTTYAITQYREKQKAPKVETPIEETKEVDDNEHLS